MQWTTADEHKLRTLWGMVTMQALAIRLGRSSKAIRTKASKLGLPFGHSRGCVSLTAAAEKGGYYRASFVRALEWYARRWDDLDVSALPAVRGSRRKGQWRQICTDDAELVAAAYAASELPGQAAKRLHLTPWTLRRRADALGYQTTTGKSGAMMRLMPDEWDKVAAYDSRAHRRLSSSSDRTDATSHR